MGNFGVNIGKKRRGGVGRERERETERQRQKQRQRQRERQRDRDRERETETNRQTDKKQADKRQIVKQTDKKTERQAKRQREDDEVADFIISGDDADNDEVAAKGENDEVSYTVQDKVKKKKETLSRTEHTALERGKISLKNNEQIVVHC